MAESMLSGILMGTAAGAVGTAGLNITTYLDMSIRGRPSSGVPARTAAKIAAGAGLRLAPGASGGQERQHIEHRRSALGALLGYVTGLGVGAAYGAIRPELGNLPVPVTGLALAGAAMAAGDLPAVLTGSTNPREWGLSGWLADAVPHLVYGILTAVAFEAFTAGPLGRRSVDRAEYLSAAMRHSSARLRR
jgi:hypothetical protein